MSLTRHPVINYLLCNECGACIAKCPGVHHKSETSASPVVKHPELCVENCHSCGNACPVGAITYVGDNTDWTPPKVKQTAEEACCSCGGEKASV